MRICNKTDGFDINEITYRARLTEIIEHSSNGAMLADLRTTQPSNLSTIFIRMNSLSRSVCYQSTIYTDAYC